VKRRGGAGGTGADDDDIKGIGGAQVRIRP
jgi:hypothetical protein